MEPNQSQTPEQISPQPPIKLNVNADIDYTILSNPAYRSLQKFKFLLPVLSLFLLLFMAAVAMYFANQLGRSTTQESADQQTLSPTPIFSEEERELQGIDTGNLDQDFKDIQSDLNKL